MNRIISAWSSAGYDAPQIAERIGEFERTTLTLPLVYVEKGIRETAESTQEKYPRNTQEIGSTDASKGESAQEKYPGKVPKKIRRKSHSTKLPEPFSTLLLSSLPLPGKCSQNSWAYPTLQ
jgi:hypothetical protein